ncbi:hypothetical protein [Mycobacterium sp. UM_CSW]|uniref:hypothetical protein n=1 Tax=Mycobacterium sp. UM_CSW TaxID=1370119 RepID=UPI00082CAEAE|nr:hypothetical protein [Mycobacterium sp. UM_CSW]
MGAADEQELEEASMCYAILSDFHELSEPAQRAMLADVGVDRLGVATILLLPRPERERLHLAIRRELAIGEKHFPRQTNRAKRQPGRGGFSDGVGENICSWGYMGYWPPGGEAVPG